jgi:hypothetical protein
MVIAVDPAELHPSVLALPGVHHVRLNSRHPDVVPLIHKLLQGGGVDGGPYIGTNSSSSTAIAGTEAEPGTGSAAGGPQVSGPASVGSGGGQGVSSDQLADLLVCDMNARPWVAREPVKDLLQFLRPGGHVVMTVSPGDWRVGCAMLDRLLHL